MKIKNSTYLNKLISGTFRLMLGLLLLGTSNAAYAQLDTIQINFGSADAIPGWNSLINFGEAIEPTILSNTRGEETTIGLMVTGTFNANNYAGTTEPDPGIGFPPQVTGSNWYSSRTSYSSFMLTGMNPDLQYLVIVFGSIMREDGDIREAEYQFIGKEEVSLLNDATLNESNIAMGQIYPDESGAVIVNCKTGPNNTNGGGNFHLSGMKLIYGAVSTGINPGTTNRALNVYPNPAKDYVTVDVAEKSRVRILDIVGKVQIDELVKPGKNKVNLNIKPGLYFLQITNETNVVSTTKFLVN